MQTLDVARRRPVRSWRVASLQGRYLRLASRFALSLNCLLSRRRRVSALRQPSIVGGFKQTGEPCASPSISSLAASKIMAHASVVQFALAHGRKLAGSQLSSVPASARAPAFAPAPVPATATATDPDADSFIESAPGDTAQWIVSAQAPAEGPLESSAARKSTENCLTFGAQIRRLSITITRRAPLRSAPHAVQAMQALHPSQRQDSFPAHKIAVRNASCKAQAMLGVASTQVCLSGLARLAGGCGDLRDLACARRAER